MKRRTTRRIQLGVSSFIFLGLAFQSVGQAQDDLFGGDAGPSGVQAQDDLFGDGGSDQLKASSDSFNPGDNSGGFGDGGGDLFEAEPQGDGGFDGFGGDSRRPKKIKEPLALAVDAGSNQHGRKWQQLRQSVLEAPDEKTRKARAAELQKFLETVFDEDLARREKELTKLEVRLKKLRDSVESRKTNRDRIIGVRMDALMLDAQGLGLPGLGSAPIGNSSKKPKVMINSIKVLGRNEDGSVAVQVVYTAVKDEQRTRTIQKTSFRRRPGSRQVVPVTEAVEQVYTVQVPKQYKSDVIVPAGEEMTQYLKIQLASQPSSRSADSSNELDWEIVESDDNAELDSIFGE